MSENRKESNTNFRKLLRTVLLHKKNIILVLLLALFLVLSVVSMWRGQEISTIGFIVASGVILIFLLPGMIESVRFGNVEMKMRQVEKTIAETRDLAKLIAEIAIPLAHHSEGWAEASPSTVQKKDAVIGRVFGLKERHGIEISDDILEIHYVKTCADYARFIVESLPEDQKKAYRKELGTTHIPTRIEDVPLPQRIEGILRKLEYWDDYMETLVEDYRYYYQNRTHRSQSKWDRRVEWQRPHTEDG